MTRRNAAVIALFAALLTPRPLVACGDKFLVVNRGTRFERPTARRPAAVLVYARAATAFSNTLIALPVEATLQKAGYRPTTVRSEQELDAALSTGAWDLVLADALDARAIRGRLRAPSTIVVPVAYSTDAADVKKLKAEFPSVLRSPTRSQTFLDAVEEALRKAPAAVKGAE